MIVKVEVLPAPMDLGIAPSVLGCWAEVLRNDGLPLAQG